MASHSLNFTSADRRLLISDQRADKAPTFSVILPTYDRPELLRRAVGTVLRQTFADFELIVVDDGSRIPVQDLSDLRDARIRFIRNPRNMGVASARNIGIEAARGAYISFIEDDDEYMSSFLSSTYDCLKNTPVDVGISWCSVELVFAGNNSATGPRRLIRRFPTEYNSGSLLFELFLSIGMGFGVTMKPGCLQKVGKFNTNLKVESDTDMFYRVVSKGFIPAVVPGVHIVHHQHLLPKLTCHATIPDRIRTSEGFLVQYSEFMDKYPAVRANHLKYLASLKKRRDYRGESADTCCDVGDFSDQTGFLPHIRRRISTRLKTWMRKPKSTETRM